MACNAIATTGDAAPSGFVRISDVVPDAILEIRYFSTYNFVGDRIDVTKPLDSSLHERQITCLDMLYELHLSIENKKCHNKKIWTLEEGRKLIDICKGYSHD